jgi:hypothetical protein
LIACCCAWVCPPPPVIYVLAIRAGRAAWRSKRRFTDRAFEKLSHRPAHRPALVTTPRDCRDQRATRVI